MAMQRLLVNMTAKQYQRLFEVSLKTSYRRLKEIHKFMKKKPSQRVTVADVAAYEGVEETKLRELWKELSATAKQ